METINEALAQHAECPRCGSVALAAHVLPRPAQPYLLTIAYECGSRVSHEDGQLPRVEPSGQCTSRAYHMLLAETKKRLSLAQHAADEEIIGTVRELETWLTACVSALGEIDELVRDGKLPCFTQPVKYVWTLQNARAVLRRRGVGGETPASTLRDDV